MLIARSHSASRLRILRRSLFVVSMILSGRSCLAASQPSQSDVEAVYLFDFGKFVRWPAGLEPGPLHICVAGSESFAAELEKTVANENINGRALLVRRVFHAEEESGCAMLFIDATEREHAADLLAGVADKPTLTVSELNDFLERGGMIQFQLVGKRVRFSINLDAVRRGHLAMSSELLKVALTVKGRALDGGVQ